MRSIIRTEVDEMGFHTEYSYDDLDKKIHVQRYQIIDDNLDQNKIEFNQHSDYRPFTGVEGAYKYASVPLGLVEKWMSEGYNMLADEDNKELKKRLNSSEYTKLRTRPGKV